jgi:hypothetical protein
MVAFRLDFPSASPFFACSAEKMEAFPLSEYASLRRPQRDKFLPRPPTPARQNCGCRNPHYLRAETPICNLFILRAAQTHDSSRFHEFVRLRFNDYFERSFNMNQILA